MSRYVCIVGDPGDTWLPGVTAALVSGGMLVRVPTTTQMDELHELVRGSLAILCLPLSNPDTAFFAGALYGARYEGEIYVSQPGPNDFGILDDFASYQPGPPSQGSVLPLALNNIPIFRTPSEVLRWCRMLEIGYEEEGGDVRGLPAGGVGWCDLYVEAEVWPVAPNVVQWATSGPDRWDVTEASNGWTTDRASLPGNAKLFTTTAYLFSDGAVYLGALRQFDNARWAMREVDWPAGTQRDL